MGQQQRNVCVKSGWVHTHSSSLLELSYPVIALLTMTKLSLFRHFPNEV